MTFTRATLWMSSGIIVWALHFGAIYGLTALACARGWQGLIAPSVIAATLAAAVASLIIILIGMRRRERFEYWIAACTAALGLVAIVWEALPVLLVPLCG